MDTTVFSVVHMFSARGISAVPILDEHGVVVNLFETVDVIVRISFMHIISGFLLLENIDMPLQALIRSGSYTQLDLSIRSALALRSPEFQGAVTCTGSDSLGKLLEFLRTMRVHRVVVVEGDTVGADGVSKKGRLVGIITLSDVLRYLVGKGEKGKDAGLAPMTPLQRGPPSPLPGVSSLPNATSLS